MSYLLFQTFCWSVCLTSAVIVHAWARAAVYAVLLAACLVLAPLTAIKEERRANRGMKS